MTADKKYIYCTKCKKKTLTNDLGTRITKNNKLMNTGHCNLCLTKKQEFASTRKVVRTAESVNESAEVEHVETKNSIYMPD